MVDGLAARGAWRSARSISSQYLESIDRLRELEPDVRRGWSVPRAQRDYTRSMWAVPAYGILQVIKRRLPARAASFIRAGRIHAVMAHHYVVTPRLATVVRRPAASSTCGRWTTPTKIARLEAMGVHGVITNDPRLFDVAPLRERDLAEPGRVVARVAVAARGVAAQGHPRRAPHDLRRSCGASGSRRRRGRRGCVVGSGGSMWNLRPACRAR